MIGQTDLYKISADFRFDSSLSPCVSLKWSKGLQRCYVKTMTFQRKSVLHKVWKKCSVLFTLIAHNYRSSEVAINLFLRFAWVLRFKFEIIFAQQALNNFMLTAVASSVLTYVLGIGDRHNDNILVRKSGHLLHIDFSKVFGNFQTIAGISRYV